MATKNTSGTTLFKGTVVGYVGFVKKLTAGDKEFLSVSVCIKRGTGDDAEREWIEVLLFGNLVKYEPYITSGRHVFAEGPQYKEEYTKADGTKGFALKIKAKEFTFLDSPGDSAAA